MNVASASPSVVLVVLVVVVVVLVVLVVVVVVVLEGLPNAPVQYTFSAIVFVNFCDFRNWINVYNFVRF